MDFTLWQRISHQHIRSKVSIRSKQNTFICSAFKHTQVCVLCVWYRQGNANRHSISQHERSLILFTATLPPIGTKLFLTATPSTPDAEKILRDVYCLYTDYVLKNPFYVVEMPIRCNLFDKHLHALIKKISQQNDS